MNTTYTPEQRQALENLYKQNNISDDIQDRIKYWLSQASYSVRSRDEGEELSAYEMFYLIELFPTDFHFY